MIDRVLYPSNRLSGKYFLLFFNPLVLKHPRLADMVAFPRQHFRKAKSYDVAFSTPSDSSVRKYHVWLLKKLHVSLSRMNH